MVENRTGIRKILVALDASPSSISALRSAVELAERLDAELLCLYVEDINLLRATQLPFTREVGLFSQTVRRLESMDLELQLRAQARVVREIVERVAGARGIAWRFRVARGSVAGEILAAGAEADLMVLGKIGRSFSGRKRTGSTSRTMVVQRPGLTLIWHSDAVLTPPVLLLYDGSESSLKALEAAGHLVRVHDGGLTVFLVGENEAEAEQLREQVEKRLGEYNLNASYRTVIRPSITGLVRRVHMESTGPVVLPCGKERLEGEKLCILVDEISNPVLLVR